MTCPRSQCSKTWTWVACPQPHCSVLSEQFWGRGKLSLMLVADFLYQPADAKNFPLYHFIQGLWQWFFTPTQMLYTAPCTDHIPTTELSFLSLKTLSLDVSVDAKWGVPRFGLKHNTPHEGSGRLFALLWWHLIGTLSIPSNCVGGDREKCRAGGYKESGWQARKSTLSSECKQKQKE